MDVVVGVVVLGLVVVGGALMARLFTTAAQRSDVWHRHGWLDDESRFRRKHGDDDA